MIQFLCSFGPRFRYYSCVLPAGAVTRGHGDQNQISNPLKVLTTMEEEDLKTEPQTENMLETEMMEKSAEDVLKEEEEDEEALPHSEVLDIFEEGLAMMVQDPLLCDLPIQVTLEEVNSQVALEYGQAMTVRVCKADGEIMPIVVVQSATVLDLKKAIQRYMELKQQREGGIKHISWKYVWRTFHLVFNGERLEEDKWKLKDYGIRNRDDVTFMKKLLKK
ncbi:U11/U12 small nuclear ribonucleoprotein 25 kDa protein [Astyanax mexicanus]|uniref:U11/U12 small nuclear ribonucleoprotein 25 kDa protein n=2 Tax=Astyanax mexicanus TaxID=7994 RepID=A0A8T2M9T7_ASTMX|nr:U11/U12 small nuclear ribonucleoprotein 25 kDa protein [Astyanax mexicanus]KAG9280007.1 U11/U12 small nuclear ribonucleoprotein 25 kDa protein [Astyanax mexicanus]